MGKNVAVFVDVANIFYAAKAAGVDIDYVTLLKAASAGRDLVRAYAYTGLDPDNENQRNFHDFLRRSNYKVVSKDIRKYGDGKVKANLDIELVVDMMKTARNLDIAIVVSGDGDFAPAIRAVQEQGVRVEVISFRGNTSSDLIEVADQFTDIVQLARVEKGTRSGRRVAEGDDLDLSMTEVPDKQTEGTGVGRSRGRGRGRGRDAEPIAASTRSRTRTRSDAPAPIAANGRSEGAGLVALPGERLSRAAGPLSEADLAKAEVFRLDDLDDEATDALDEATREPGAVEDGDGDEPRRRRRRGGRGRGRGRGRGEEGAPDEADVEVPERAAAAAAAPAPRPLVEDDEADIAPVPRTPRATPFGSVWDSQLGTPSASTAPRAPITDDEDFDEPEIPEYLIAEQRRGGNRAGGGGGGGRGARGGRSAYQSAMERERYGRGGGGGGINRYPDVSARPRPSTPPREERSYGRPDRPAAASTPRNSNEPWSDVPPELEAMLRAQVAQKPAPGRRPAAPVAASEPVIDVEATGTEAVETVEEAAPAPKAKAARRTSTRGSAARATETASSDVTEASEAAPAAEVPAAKPRATRKPSTKAVAASAAPEGDIAPAPAEAEATAESGPAPKATRARAPRKPAAAKAAAAPEAPVEGEAATVAAPKRRSTRKAAPAETA